MAKKPEVVYTGDGEVIGAEYATHVVEDTAERVCVVVLNGVEYFEFWRSNNERKCQRIRAQLYVDMLLSVLECSRSDRAAHPPDAQASEKKEETK